MLSDLIISSMSPCMVAFAAPMASLVWFVDMVNFSIISDYLAIVSLINLTALAVY